MIDKCFFFEALQDCDPVAALIRDSQFCSADAG